MSDLPKPAEPSAQDVAPEPAPQALPAVTPPVPSEPALSEPDVAADAAVETTTETEVATAAETASSVEENAPDQPAPVPVPVPVPTAADLSPAACAARLAELFPALFGAGRALPIKLRIQNDIQQRAPGIFTRKSLSPFLHRYTTSTAYLKALVNSPHRFDLDGGPAGDIEDVHRQAAATELERRRGLFEAKRAAERADANEARRAAEAAAREKHAAEDQARRDRATLLRAYESSTLTRANFCALKGIAEADLDGQLHQAWLEREQRSQEVPPGTDRGPSPRDARRADERRNPRDEARAGGRPNERPNGPSNDRSRDRQPGHPPDATGPRAERGPQRPRGAAAPKPAR